jgi:hypothetical protein
MVSLGGGKQHNFRTLNQVQNAEVAFLRIHREHKVERRVMTVAQLALVTP